MRVHDVKTMSEKVEELEDIKNIITVLRARTEQYFNEHEINEDTRQLVRTMLQNCNTNIKRIEESVKSIRKFVWCKS